MKEYIEKEAVLEILKRNSVGTWRGVPAYPAEIKSAAHEIGNLPAADVAEVRHGKIIETIKDGKMNRVFSCYGHDFTELTCWYMPKYCPNCGARMDKEDEHGSEFD